MDKKVFIADKISKQYTDKVGYKINLLQDIDLQIGNNEFISLLAPKGSGKSSLLKICAGIDIPSSGKISTDLIKLPFIPSEPSSFPWLNVIDNVRFNSKLKSDQINAIIDSVGLHGYEYHYPNSKSEGFRFRIALARALAFEANLIVIDEPFNNLNAETRKEIYTLLRQIHFDYNISVLFGTTNISEAIFLSDRIYLLKKNPGEVVEEITTQLPKNRELKVFSSKEFINIRTHIENIFKEKTDQTFYNFSI